VLIPPFFSSIYRKEQFLTRINPISMVRAALAAELS
jgi:hypothetical protein